MMHDPNSIRVVYYFNASYLERKCSSTMLLSRSFLFPFRVAKRPVRLAYQPPASSTFLSQQTSHQQPASSTLLSEQTSTSHQPPANRTG
jgi:hypothetical protein